MNCVGEMVDVEEELICPLIKYSDVKCDVITQNRKYVIVTQHNTNEDTTQMKDKYPKAYQYLIAHAGYMDNRKSTIYKNRPRFCMFGIGDYTFKKYKVIISGLYKQTSFSLASEINGKTVVCDDTCYMLGFDSYDVARLTCGILNSQPVQDFVNSICFYEAKRAINKDMLMRINLLPALYSLDAPTIGITKEELDKASEYIIQRCKVATSQQCINFETVHS